MSQRQSFLLCAKGSDAELQAQIDKYEHLVERRHAPTSPIPLLVIGDSLPPHPLFQSFSSSEEDLQQEALPLNFPPVWLSRTGPCEDPSFPRWESHLRWPLPATPHPFYLHVDNSLEDIPPLDSTKTKASSLSFKSKEKKSELLISGRLLLRYSLFTEDPHLKIHGQLYERSPTGTKRLLKEKTFSIDSLPSSRKPPHQAALIDHDLGVLFHHLASHHLLELHLQATSTVTFLYGEQAPAFLLLPISNLPPSLPLETPVCFMEVTPRDGLQGIPTFIPTKDKANLVSDLGEAGCTRIEVSSFVSPKWIPQMADATELFHSIPKKPDVQYSALVPNEKGLEQALQAGVKHIALFTAASQSFAMKNINCTIEESLKRFAPVVVKAHENGLSVRGYLSCCLGCPYEGKVEVEKVIRWAQELYSLGCQEIVLSDTIGSGSPLEASLLARKVLTLFPAESLAVHFHGPPELAIANILACLEEGIVTVDTSLSGFGGCPYANGASSNAPTERLVALLDTYGIHTGINLEALLRAKKNLLIQLDSLSNP